MMGLYAYIDDDVLHCPLNTDVNSCAALPTSPINFCPETKETEDWQYINKIPTTCPLRKDNIIIRLLKGGE